MPRHGPSGNVPPPGDLGSALWVFLPSAEQGCVGGHTLLPTPLAPQQWTLVGNDCSIRLLASGADALWVYDQGMGLQRVDALNPGQGAWAYAAAGGTLTLVPATATTTRC